MIYFSFAFIFRSIKPKIQKYLAAIYLFGVRSIHIYNFISRHTLSGAVTRKGLTTPLTRRVARCYYLCAGAVYVVLLGSPTGSITLVSYLREIPPLCCIIPSSLGKYRRSCRYHQGEFLAPLPGKIFIITRFLITNLISLQFTLFSICLSFSSPPLHKKIAFLFAAFFVRLFLVRSIFCFQS